MPAAKKKLSHRIGGYWSTSEAAKAWMTYHEGASPEVRDMMERQRVTDDRCWACLLSKITALFTDKTQLQLLNPGGPNPEGDRFFGENGPLLELRGERPTWEDWKKMR